MSLLDAVIEPRVHSQLLPDTVYLEEVTLDCVDCLTLDQDGDPIPGRYQQLTSSSNSLLVNALKSRGHDLTFDSGSFGVCQIIGVSSFSLPSPTPPRDTVTDVEFEQNNLMTAVSDPRKGGKPAAAT
jgi:hypothetical protein